MEGSGAPSKPRKALPSLPPSINTNADDQASKMIAPPRPATSKPPPPSATSAMSSIDVQRHGRSGSAQDMAAPASAPVASAMSSGFQQPLMSIMPTKPASNSSLRAPHLPPNPNPNPNTNPNPNLSLSSSSSSSPSSGRPVPPSPTVTMPASPPSVHAGGFKASSSPLSAGPSAGAAPSTSSGATATAAAAASPSSFSSSPTSSPFPFSLNKSSTLRKSHYIPPSHLASSMSAAAAAAAAPPLPFGKSSSPLGSLENLASSPSQSWSSSSSSSPSSSSSSSLSSSSNPQSGANTGGAHYPPPTNLTLGRKPTMLGYSNGGAGSVRLQGGIGSPTTSSPAASGSSAGVSPSGSPVPSPRQRPQSQLPPPLSSSMAENGAPPLPTSGGKSRSPIPIFPKSPARSFSANAAGSTTTTTTTTTTTITTAAEVAGWISSVPSSPGLADSKSDDAAVVVSKPTGDASAEGKASDSSSSSSAPHTRSAPVQQTPASVATSSSAALASSTQSATSITTSPIVAAARETPSPPVVAPPRRNESLGKLGSNLPSASAPASSSSVQARATPSDGSPSSAPSGPPPPVRRTGAGKATPAPPLLNPSHSSKDVNEDNCAGNESSSSSSSLMSTSSSSSATSVASSSAFSTATTASGTSSVAATLGSTPSLVVTPSSSSITVSSESIASSEPVDATLLAPSTVVLPSDAATAVDQRLSSTSANSLVELPNLAIVYNIRSQGSTYSTGDELEVNVVEPNLHAPLQNLSSGSESGGHTSQQAGNHSDHHGSHTAGGSGALVPKSVSEPEELDGIYAIVLHPYAPIHEDDLQLNEGDKILLLDTDSKEWWHGELVEEAAEKAQAEGRAVKGYFPAAYVEAIVVDGIGKQSPMLMEPQEAGDPKSSMTTRQRIIQEIVNTEKDYVQDLLVVIKGYKRQMQLRQDFFSPQQIEDVFANVEDIYDFQVEFSADMQHAVQSSTPEKSLAELFMTKKDKFKIYSSYCANHPKASAALVEYQKVDSMKFFFLGCRLLLEQDISLEGFLLTPIQRLCKYPLLLKELIKSYRDEEPSEVVSKLNEALDAMKEVATFVNEMQRHLDNLKILDELQTRFENWEGPNMSETNGELLMEGTFNKISGGKSQERRFFLLDRTLVYSRENPLKKGTYAFKGCIPLDRAVFVNLADDSVTLNGRTVLNALRIDRYDLGDGRSAKTYVLYTDKADTKDRWLNAIERLRQKMIDNGEFVITQSYVNRLRGNGSGEGALTSRLSRGSVHSAHSNQDLETKSGHAPQAKGPDLERKTTIRSILNRKKSISENDANLPSQSSNAGSQSALTPTGAATPPPLPLMDSNFASLIRELNAKQRVPGAGPGSAASASAPASGGEHAASG